MNYVLAYDLGTGGCKASLYDENGKCINECFTGYETTYRGSRIHEQSPRNWWEAVCTSTVTLLKHQPPRVKKNIKAIGLSGHSLGFVPLDSEGELVMDTVPIWSDSRPEDEDLAIFFNRVSEKEWYETTGNGFPPSLYTLFKILWLKRTDPELFNRINTVIGTKDYINYKLCGVVATDNSYASGTGIYDLGKRSYSPELLKASGLRASLFPPIFPSHHVLGQLTEEAAELLGLSRDVSIVAGGVDNSCMALGAACFREGNLYNSLGSSSWIAVSSSNPLINIKTRPFVFDHVVEGQYASATSIFSAGSSYKWFQEEICRDLKGPDIYCKLDQMASSVPPGAEGLIFNPTLAGGNTLDKSPLARGGFLGLTLSHNRAHMTRAVLEGIAFGLKRALNELQNLTEVDNKLIIVGGGSKSDEWRQIIADIFNITIVKSNIDQQAAALGAAALAIRGAGLQDDYSFIDRCHLEIRENKADPKQTAKYDKLYNLYLKAADFLSDLGENFTEVS